MPKYAFQQARFELEFNKIDTEWVSIQTILDQVFSWVRNLRPLINFRIQHVVIWMSKQPFKNAGSQIKFPQIPTVKIFPTY